MVPSRRDFLFMGLVAASATALGGGALAQGNGYGGPSAGARDPYQVPTPERPRFNPRDLLAANQKNIQKDVERLAEIVEQLQKQLDDNDTRDVLPLDVIKKTDEIQKIAKHINSLVRG